MNTKFDGENVLAPKDAKIFYEQNGYGRLEKDGRLRLDTREALYLLARGKIEVAGWTFDTLLAECSKKPGFLRSFIVYRDIRERGYVITAGPQDFRIFARGQKPGNGTSRYLMRVLSERDIIDFSAIIADAKAAANMRKTFILAVLDDEHELTYYAVKTGGLPDKEPQEIPGGLVAVLDGVPACVSEDGTGITARLAGLWLGRMLDETRLFLSPVETAWLLETGRLALIPALSAQEYIALAGAADSEFLEKLILYRSLRAQGFCPRSGYKFGHHFRVYTEAKSHSEMLIHAVPFGTRQSMSEISRSVRLAHSVRKKMLFACLDETGELTEIEFARMKM